MTQYESIRKALENDTRNLLCNCKVYNSCVCCEHLPVCAMARRLRTAIIDDKRFDRKPTEFEKLSEFFVKELRNDD